MALIPVYFTIAGQFLIDNSSLTPIAPGTLLTLTANADNQAVVSAATASTPVLGLAGDGFRTETLNPPASGYAADLITGAYGNTSTRSTNRINDLYRDTAGSGKMTVYSGVGTFRTTMYDTTMTYTLGQKLYSNASGAATNQSGSGNSIGYVVELPQAYPNGVPGTDVDGSMSLGTYLTLNLTC